VHCHGALRTSAHLDVFAPIKAVINVTARYFPEPYARMRMHAHARTILLRTGKCEQTSS
jgi:hypothetical protein